MTRNKFLKINFIRITGVVFIVFFICGFIHSGYAVAAFDNYLHFDGGARAIIPNGPSLNPLQYTIETWIKFNRLACGGGHSGTDGQFIISKGGDRTEGRYGIQQGGACPSSYNICTSLGRYNSNLYICSSALSLETDHWYHIAGTYDGNAIKIFLDGILQGSQDVGSVGVGNGSPLYFGFNDVSGFPYYLNGAMKEVRLWNMARSESDIQSHMNTMLTGNEPGLAGYWRLNEESGQIIYDSSANGNDGYLGSTLNEDGDDPMWYPGVGWFDDFEGYGVGQFPSSGWTYSGNSSISIDNTQNVSGSKSVRLYGTVGGCWGALLHKKLNILPPFTIDFYVKNGAENINGCHPQRAVISLHTGASWTTSGRTLITFDNQGKVRGASPSQGGFAGNTETILGQYSTNEWIKVKLVYEMLGSMNVGVSYWINDDYKGSEMFSAFQFENNLDYLSLTTGEGTVWYDDVLVRPGIHAGNTLGISPREGGNAGQVTVTVFGQNFAEGTTVKLVREGQEIAGINTSVATSSRLTSTFDLVGKPAGLWDLAVSLPDDSQLICEDCFTVEEGGEAKLWVEIIGSDRIRVGRMSSFSVRYGNSGNIDVRYPWVVIGVPAKIIQELDIPYALPHVPIKGPFDDSLVRINLIDIPPITAGGTSEIIIKLKPMTTDNLTIYARLSDNAIPYLGEKQSITNIYESSNTSHKAFENADSFPLDWQKEIDWGPSPPPGWVMIWDLRNSGGDWEFHIAKSIGNGKFVEMTPNSNGPDLRISDTTNAELDIRHPAYQGAMRTPLDSEAHREQILNNSLADVLKWGQNDSASIWTDELCLHSYDDVLISNCIKYFKHLNPEFEGWNIDELYDFLHPDKYWDGSYKRLRYEGLARINNLLLTESINTDQGICLTAGDDLVKGDSKSVSAIQAVDPNDKAGPAGFDSEGTPEDQLKKYIVGDHSLGYMIFYENLETATAAAQEVLITDQLDSNLDWTTFQFGDMQVGEKIISIEGGQKNFSTKVDLRPSMPVLADVDCSFNQTNGLIQCLFRGEDLETGELADLLPPNTIQEDPKGQGWFSYNVKPKANLPTGTIIRNKATIDFEVDIPPAPMDTPEVFNTIDSGKPSSDVAPLALIQNSANFGVSWSGVDDTGGSGIKNYEIYVSDNGAPYYMWTNASTTSAIFTGHNGHQYSFYSRARDNVGNIEDAPEYADTTTTVSEIQYQYILTVTKAGTGNGMITSSPKGINCGSDCTEICPIGKKPVKMTLKVKPDANSTFLGWGGACQASGMKKSCKLAMDSDKDVTANFGVPDISVSPDSYDFGNVAVKQSSSPFTFTFQNEGTGTLRITRLKVIGADAKMFKPKGGGKKLIPPGGNYLVSVTFKPTSAGPKNAILQIASNDPANPVIEIPLGGAGL